MNVTRLAAPALALLVPFVSLAACGEDEAKGDATTSATTDASTATDTALSDDTTSATDAAETDAATETEVVATDAGSDADASPPCVPDDVVFEEPRIFECKGLLTQVLYWEDLSASACPGFYTAGDDRYDSAEALADALDCDAACEYRSTLAVDFVGCESGARTGYYVFEPLGEGCLPAVYGTPHGPMRDLCNWEEKACYADCNEDCQEGVVGTVDQAQLSGAAGTLYATSGDGALGQTFVVGDAGILTGIEVRLTRCDSTVPATLVVRDAEGNEIAWGEKANDQVPAGCAEAATSLTEGAPGAGYFAIETQCLPVAAGDVMSFLVAPAPCAEAPCPEQVGLGIAAGNPYAQGTVVNAAGTAFQDEDLAFKVFVK